jgi:WD40 repeat protein
VTERVGSAYDLFISYANADRAWVEGYLLDGLIQAGVRCHTEAAFALGVPRLLEFERAVQESQRTLLVLSPAYLAEGFTQFTDLLAQSYGLKSATWPVIPLILQPVELPPRLALLTTLDATDPANWPQVIARLCAEPQQAAPGPAPRPACPYPGMVPFSEDDSERFFGREREAQELLERLRLHPFLAVIGPSGSGKSSLVFAGLLPALRKSGLFGPGGWLVRTVRPGKAPLAALAAALGGDPASLAETIPALLATEPDTRRLLLVVDQFEELFTLTRTDAEPFQRALLRLAETPNCYVVLTVRADFYPDLMAAPLWPEIQAHRAEVLPLDEDGLRQAIARPAENAGVFVEGTLVERLIADAAGEPGVLPLVQEALVLLWERLVRRFLPLSAYEALGGAGRTGLQAAMARRADVVLADLTLEQQAIARRMFLRLVQFGEGRADTRRQQPVSALRAAGDTPGAFERTLEHLAQNRLLTLSGEERAADRQVDIAHEALITGWPTLQTWLSQRREAEQTRRRLEAKAAEWERLGQSTGGLLDEVELAEAERWLGSPYAADLGRSEALPALVAASREAIETARREKEATRRRELEQAQALAAAERRRAEEQALFSKRLRARLVIAVTLALIAILAAVGAGYGFTRAVAERNRAEQQAHLALSRQLAVQSTSELDANNYDLALLLAIEAGRAADTAEAFAALRQAFAYPGRPLLILSGHTGPVWQAVWNADESRILTASWDGTARVWDAQTGEELLILSGHTDPVWQAAWNADESRILTASEDSTARVWDAQTGEELLILSGHTGGVKQAVWNRGESRILTASKDGTAQVWDAQTGEELLTLSGHTGEVNQAVWNADESRILTVGYDGAARVWDAQTGEELLTLSGHTGEVNQAVWNRDESRILTASWDYSARVWDAQTGERLLVLSHVRSSVNQAVWNADESRILTVGYDGAARVWDAQARAELLTPGEELLTLSAHRCGVTEAAWNADENRILTAGCDRCDFVGRVVQRCSEGEARVWDAQTGEELLVLSGHTDWVNQAVWNADESRILTASNDGTALVWDVSATLNTGVQMREELLVLSSHNGGVSQAVWNADESRILTAGCDRRDETGQCSEGTARVWDAQRGETLVVLSGHTGEVNQAVWNRDESRILTAGEDSTARVWDAQTGEELLTVSGYRAVWSADESRILTASEDGTTRVWDAQTREELLVLSGHNGTVYQVVWNRDESRILTASWDRTARVWDAQTGEELAVLSGHGWAVNHAVWNADESRILTASWDGTARVWDAQTGEELLTLSGHKYWLGQAVWNRDESRILTAGCDRRDEKWDGLSAWQCSEGTARVWDAQTGEELLVLSGHTREVNQAVWNRDESRILTAGEDGTARLWDAQTGEELLTVSGYRAVWSADESRILTTNRWSARVWDVSDLSKMGAQVKEELVILSSHTGGVNQAVWNTDGSRILTAGCDRRDDFGRCLKNTARVWDAQTGEELLTLSGHTGEVKQAVWNADESRILTASWDGTTRVWDAQTGEELLAVSGHSAVWNRDGSRILTAGEDGTARVWDAQTGKELVILSGHEYGVNQAVWNRDESRILTAGEDGTARVWDAQTGEEALILSGHEYGVNQAVWNRDESRILTAGEDSTARVWDAQTGEELLTLSSHEYGVNQAVWNPDGSRILTAGCDRILSGERCAEGTARVWDARTGEELVILSGHTEWVNQAVWNADGSRILTAGCDQQDTVVLGTDSGRCVESTARVWDAQTGEELAVLSGHIGEVNQAVWNGDESRILTASSDGTVRQWYTRMQDLLDAACRAAPRNMTREEWQRLMRGENYRATCPNLPIKGE